MKKVVMALSGGIDSATLLAHLLDYHFEVECVSFTYGSKHNPYENLAAIRIATHYAIPLHSFDLTGIMKMFKSNLLKDGGDIPEGHYADESMSETVVPARNIIFLSILSGYGLSIGANLISIGVHQGDHAIYADCRLEFCKAMDGAIYLGTDKKIEMYVPFIEMDKTQIVKRGIELNVPYRLTRTCYKDQSVACGKCGSCVERKEAFESNSVEDPIKIKY